MRWSRYAAPFLFAVCGLVSVGAIAQDDEKLDDATFKKLHAELQPGDEAWRSIPWRTSLLQAQQDAAEEGKLIFIWAMDGHPLGCT